MNNIIINFKKKNILEKSLVLGKKNFDLNCLIKYNVIYLLSI